MSIRSAAAFSSRNRRFSAFIKNPALNTVSTFEKAATFSGGIQEDITTVTSASSINIDPDASSIQTVTLDTSATFTFTNFEIGQSVTLIIKQDGTGSRTGTFVDPATNKVRFPGGDPTLTTDANAIDVITVVRSADSDYLGNIAQDFKTG